MSGMKYGAGKEARQTRKHPHDAECKKDHKSTKTPKRSTRKKKRQ